MARPAVGRRRRALARRVAALPCVVAILALVPAADAGAAEFVVTTTGDPTPPVCVPGGECSLRGAVIAANENGAAEPDVIRLDPGTYRPLRLGSGGAEAGDLDLTSGSVTIAGAGATETEVVGGGGWEDRLFEVPAGVEEVTLRDLRISGGNSPADSADVRRGGGILVEGSARLVRVRMTGNDAGASGEPGLGGAIFNGGDLEIVDSTLDGNTVTPIGFGAGVYSIGARTVLRRVTASGNEAAFGAAIVAGGSGVASVMDVVDSTISGNSGDFGAGIYASGDAFVDVWNTTLSGNEVFSEGAAIRATGGPAVQLRNATVTDNEVDVDGDLVGAGAVAVDALAAPTAVTLINTIVAGNVAPSGSRPDCFVERGGIVESGGYNLIGNATGCDFDPETGDQVGGIQDPLDPRLGDLAHNGGPTRTHALRPGSPAIDAGNPADPGPQPPAVCLGADQRGAPRSGCDVGAYELRRCRGEIVNRVGTPGRDDLTGTGGRDGFLLLGGADVARGRAGADAACGGPGPDRLVGGRGPDALVGHRGRDRMIGGPGSDVALGGPGADLLRGGRQGDILRGARSPDRLRGGPGPDRLHGGPGRDDCVGGAGRDVLRTCAP